MSHGRRVRIVSTFNTSKNSTGPLIISIESASTSKRGAILSSSEVKAASGDIDDGGGEGGGTEDVLASRLLMAPLLLRRIDTQYVFSLTQEKARRVIIELRTLDGSSRRRSQRRAISRVRAPRASIANHSKTSLLPLHKASLGVMSTILRTLRNLRSIGLKVRHWPDRIRP